MSALRFVLALALLLGLAACGEDGGAAVDGRVVSDCVVPLPEGVTDLGAPVALEYPEGSLWIFESLPLVGGGEVRNALAMVSSAEGACEAAPALVRDDDGKPVSCLELSAGEVVENAAREDGRRLDLVPGAGFVHESVGYLFYDERLSGPGIFDQETLGRGLCVFEDGPAKPCRRLTLDGSTRLWSPASHPFNRPGFIEDGFVLLPGCFRPAAFEDMCVLARAPLGGLADPSTYQYFNPFGDWQADYSNAGVLFRHAGRMSLRWNEYLGQYLALGADIWGSRFVAYLADEATGPYSNAIRLFDAVKPASFFLAGGQEHAALAGDGDRLLALSYFTNAEGPLHGLHLVIWELE